MPTLELEARLDKLLSTAQEETKDIDLFAPINIEEREECPICLIPFPIENNEIIFKICCGKNICIGCVEKHVSTEIHNGVPIEDYKCAFCCQLTLSGPPRVKALKKLMKRNYPDAFIEMGVIYERGKYGVLQSNTKALEMLIRAAELGYVDAFRKIGYNYMNGNLVEQDKSKAVEFYEVSAKKGSVKAHKNLALTHMTNENADECIQHLVVAASAGDQLSMDSLMEFYKDNSLSKEDLAQTLRAYQASSNEMKSKDRDDARRTRN